MPFYGSRIASQRETNPVACLRRRPGWQNLSTFDSSNHTSHRTSALRIWGIGPSASGRRLVVGRKLFGARHLEDAQPLLELSALDRS
jgi:hypothetical protein